VLFGGRGKNSAVFLSRFLTPLVAKRPKTRAKQPREERESRKTKNGGKKATFFVISPDVFWGILFFTTPLVTKRPNARQKNRRKNKNKNQNKIK
jgi:hypothetical protein